MRARSTCCVVFLPCVSILNTVPQRGGTTIQPAGKVVKNLICLRFAKSAAVSGDRSPIAIAILQQLLHERSRFLLTHVSGGKR